ncbi:hypothetical protein DL96DRAFT_1559076 [Flagelloscypha sp. PMI_526]|nr:hypothetical protein DL96DRAFT_1559076 [Flagelloscypha sp. PMI_526]
MLQMFPEELIERILSLALDPPPLPTPSSPDYAAFTQIMQNRPSCLLTSRTLRRIGLPLYYASVQLQSKKQARGYFDLLTERPDLILFLSHISFSGVWPESTSILRICPPSLTSIEFTLDRQAPAGSQLTWGAPDTVPGSPFSHVAPQSDIEDFCTALQKLQNVRTLTVRKAQNLYITSPRARTLLQATSKAILHWQHLMDVQMLFTLPDDVDEDGLPSAIASRPKLRSLTTCTPSLWNNAFPQISANPSIQSIQLLSSSSPRGSVDLSRSGATASGTNVLLSTGLFMTKMKHHPRLKDLVMKGTVVAS